MHRDVESQQPRERLARHWTWQQIAADHNLIDARRTRVSQDRFEGRKISVNVVKGGNTHALIIVRTRLRPLHSKLGGLFWAR